MAKANTTRKKARHSNAFFSFIKENRLFSLMIFAALAFVLKNTLRNHLLSINAVETTATVTDHTNPIGNNNVARQFTHSYLFKIHGKAYHGNTQSTEYKPGDIVKVKYLPAYPDFNEIVESR
ncbi:hypothetical protein KBK19_16105 [Microvirga sp. STR05]|uniref:DUF3592 domain-containing protein n=1 Tax=Hymenobacter duratus TaxID=2771356 RepID=A0ABR8JMH1_9BACT|nr:hypothetical protein [Hymenobacter duratus]MBD2716567.1 hypothetical protein [Hymenobacter duratus]MBR7951482.1 hypothetical protein [Microvirga sp. STR05]